MPALILNDNSKVAESVKICEEMALQAIGENPEQWLVGFGEETKTGFNIIKKKTTVLYFVQSKKQYLKFHTFVKNPLLKDWII